MVNVVPNRDCDLGLDRDCDLGLERANLDVKKAKTLSDKKLAVKFAPIGKECDAFLSRVNRYLSNQSVLNLGSAAVRSAPYVLGTSSSKAADFFRARAAFAEVALMAAVSTVFNLLCAIGSTALALGTFGQVKGFNEMTKRNWLHTGLAVFTTASGAAGVFAPAIGAGAFKYACKKTIASFANQAQEIFQHAKQAKLGEHGLARALFAHYKETLQNMGHTAIQVGSYISADVAKILDDNAALMIEDTFATKKEELDKAHKAKQKALKEDLKLAKKELKENSRDSALARFSKEELKQLAKKYPEQADFTNKKIAKELEKKFAADLKAEDKAYAKAVKDLRPEKEQALARSSTFFNTLKDLARDEMTLAGFEEVVETLVDGVEQKAKGDKPKYEELVRESKGLLTTLVGQSLNAVRTATADVDLDHIKATPAKNKKQQKALVKGAQEEIKLARKEEKFARVNAKIIQLDQKQNKLEAKISTAKQRIGVLEGQEKRSKEEKAEVRAKKDEVTAAKKALKALKKQRLHLYKAYARATGVIKKKDLKMYEEALARNSAGKALSDKVGAKFSKIQSKVDAMAQEMIARTGSKPVQDTLQLAETVVTDPMGRLNDYAPRQVAEFVSAMRDQAQVNRYNLGKIEEVKRLTQNGKFDFIDKGNEEYVLVSKTSQKKSFTTTDIKTGKESESIRDVHIGNDGLWYARAELAGPYGPVTEFATQESIKIANKVFGEENVKPNYGFDFGF